MVEGQRVQRVLLGFACGAALMHATVAAGAPLTSQLRVNGASVYTGFGNLGANFEFEKYYEVGDTHFAYKGKLRATPYGDMRMDFSGSTTDLELPSVSQNISIEAAREDLMEMVWAGAGPAPAVPSYLTYNCKADGGYKILPDWAALSGWGFGGGFTYDFKAGDTTYNIGTYFDPWPGEYQSTFTGGFNVPIADGPLPLEWFFSFRDPTYNTNTTATFSGNSVGFESILMPDGTTPESNGWELVFASGALSPNLRPIPEPSTLALTALGLLGLMGWRWRRRR